MTGPTLYRISQLASTRSKPGIVPLSESTIWQRVKNKTFPAPVKVSTRVVCWRAADVEKWLENPAAPWGSGDDGAEGGANTSETKKP